MDHQRPPNGFVHQATRVAAVHPPGAAPTVWASRRGRGAADLNVDSVIHLEHAVDTQPGQMRKQTNQTQTSTSGARVPWVACAGQVYRKSADGRHDSRARATCKSALTRGKPASAQPTQMPQPTATSQNLVTTCSGMHPVELIARRKKASAAARSLEHLPAGEWVGQVPPDCRQDHVRRPAVPAAGRSRALRERAPTRATHVLLATATITTVALGGGLLAGGAGRHELLRLQHPTSSQTPGM
jgi:hypothetical protein